METSAKKTKYTFSFKLKVIQFAEQKGKHAAAKLFKIDRKRMREWCKKFTKKEKCNYRTQYAKM
jgi:transposase-like protein